ncbi:MAG: hypothetical protein HOK21_16980 [Rhodospirillaceae bacterium]|jgi:hypothetical protein|nr:hypothetical protein [Rhodospirillaceae bacterium]MBT4042022.1 hypothetical protein [Rhodospirillaceae bacterium]MBT4690336.1 hypothetical protein [Rhodospirillaceae bacterium]MBT5079304.1 hypothetical protein [Rhodospirillaceae bacterium]MBT5525780.1 hypothetical protein [Rhodospirillaceae bacterium]
MIQIYAASIFEASRASNARPTVAPMDWRQAESTRRQQSMLSRCNGYWQSGKSACLRKVAGLG